MKKFASLALVGMMLMGQANAEAFKAPDILIDSKLDYNFSGLLVDKFRLLLKNYKMKDPFAGKMEAPILVNESEVGSYLSGDSKELLQSFGNAIGLNLIRTETKVWLHGLAYDVKGFKTNLRASEKLADGLMIGTDFSASEVSLTAEKISLTLVIPGKNSSPIFKVDLIRPEIIASEEDLINFFTKIKIQDNRDHFKLQIKNANFDQMARGLIERPENIELNYERIDIPEVSLKIGNKTIDFSPEKIQNLLRRNHEAIKGIVLAQAAKTLQSNTTQAAFKVVEQFKMNKEFWLSTSLINSQFNISEFSGAMDGESLQIDMPGDFCTSQKFTQLNKNCVHNKDTQTAATRLNAKMHSRSIVNMHELMDRGDANLVASISEDYVNKLLVTTYDAGLWKQALDEAGVELGPNKVILRLDKKGDSATLIMDVLYKPSKVERVVTGSRQIRFPLVVDVALRIEKHDGEPVVIIRLNDVDTSDETLTNGKPADNIISTVKDISRFRGKVVKAIRSKVSSLKGKDIIELRYPQFSGMGLDKVDFLSDGQGRMNAVMRLEDLLSESDY